MMNNEILLSLMHYQLCFTVAVNLKLSLNTRLQLMIIVIIDSSSDHYLRD